MLRTCRVCGDDFTPTESQIRCSDWRCKVCVAAQSKEWRIANPERAKAASRRWRTNHPNYGKDWRIAHPEQVRAASRRWREANPERVAAMSRRWREVNAGRTKATHKKWYATNSEQARATGKDYRAVNPEKIFAQRAVNRAIKIGALARLPCENCGREKAEAHHEDYKQLLVVTWLCRWCHQRLHAYKREAVSQ